MTPPTSAEVAAAERLRDAVLAIDEGSLALGQRSGEVGAAPSEIRHLRFLVQGAADRTEAALAREAAGR